MGDEKVTQEFIRSCLNVEKQTKSQTIQVCTQPAPICEMIYIPETGEVVGLTIPEAVEFIDTADKFDKQMQSVLKANDSGDYAVISKIKEQHAVFIDNEAQKVINNPAPPRSDGMKPLHVYKGQEFVEVIQFSGKKWRFMPRNLVETFRKKSKVMPLTEAAKQAYNTHAKAKPVTKNDVSANLPSLRTRQRKIKAERIKQQFGKISGGIKHKWNLIQPTDQQLPSKYALMLFGGPVASALAQTDLLDRWTDSLDLFIAKLNENLKYTYSDKEDRKKDLLELLKIKDKKKDTFDETSFGQFQYAVNYIWDESDELEHETLVSEVTALTWEKFSSDLAKSRKTWTDRLTRIELPEFIFNASAQAQFLRYSYGATASVNFDPVNGKLSAKAEANASASLVEGKANAKWYLPNNQGFELKIKNNAGSSFFVWKPIDYYIPSVSTFVTDRSFILPATAYSLKPLVDAWELNGRESHSHALHVIGHADSRGTNKHNMELSERRSQAAFELLTYNYKAWFNRFMTREWGPQEIKYMLTAVANTTYNEKKITDPSWISVVKKYQMQYLDGTKKRKSHIFVGVEKGCTVSNNTAPVLGFKPDGKIGIANSAEQQTLLNVIEDYMVTVLNGRFMLPEYFYNPESSGQGEEELKSPEQGDVPENRRLTFRVLQRMKVDGGKTNEFIPLGMMRFNVEVYLTGFVGANVFASAEIAFSGKEGKALIKGLRQGGGDQLDKESKSIDKRGRPRYDFKDGLKTTAGAFAGAQATAGIKALAEWKTPDISPTMRMPNPLVRPGQPMKLCTTDQQADDLLKEWGIDKKGFLELASAGYAVTGTAGIGLEGSFQIGFDPVKGKFLIKAHAKATLGLGFGGAFEYSVSARHVYFFIRFVHTQLNDHNFSYLDFFDEQAFDYFCAWSFKLLKQGRLLESGYMAFGASGMKLLGSVRTLKEEWDSSKQSANIANELANLINTKGTALLSFTTPEVKGRLLHKICYGEYFSDDKNKEKAIMTILSTMASKREYYETLERMGTGDLPAKPNYENDKAAIDAREKAKAKRRDEGASRISWMLDNEMKNEFIKWHNKLPDVAPPIGK